eukprot:GHUV01004160.1.p1 GENE.GHUV01004160.1~~GHUV01004160.1.p1  ORF type:complete len:213 (+),score=38.58 GHUV01004160.1:192-830(+)
MLTSLHNTSSQNSSAWRSERPRASLVRAPVCRVQRASSRGTAAAAGSRGNAQRTSVAATETTTTAPGWLRTLLPFTGKTAAEPLVPTISAAELSDILESLPTAGQATAVVVVFSAVWCGPCKVMMQRLESISKSHRSHGVKVVKIDTDESEGGSELASQLGIHKLPTMVFCGPQEGKSTIHLQGLVKESYMTDLVLNRCQYLGNDLHNKMAW